MRDRIDPQRRTVIKTLSGLTLGTTAMAATASARSKTRVSASDTTVDPDRTGAYTGTVDRIVDGEHVVILLEEGDETVDQVVVSSEEYPDLEERDSVLVVLEDGEVQTIRRFPRHGMLGSLD